MEQLPILMVFLPLMGYFSSFLFSYFPRISLIFPCIFVALSFCAWCVFFKEAPLEYAHTFTFFEWLKIGKLRVSFGLWCDFLNLSLCGLISFISFFVHIYSLGYMKNDENLTYFMGLLSLFTFMMMFLVTAPTYPQLFLGWEGVGVISYLLIGFWFQRPKANQAAMKAFIVNRVADVGLLLGIVILFNLFGTLNIEGILNSLSFIKTQEIEFCGAYFKTTELLAFLFFISAMGKSAQIIFHVWLPDAMEGPTPASALIHAATMVTAGVFLIVRLAPLYQLAPKVSCFIGLIGGITSLYGASVAFVQHDIKKIIAYSTCSQLGYMMLACSVGGYSVGIFHLFTHAFFKALLFLGAGSVIHALSGDQDIRRMGGVWKSIPFTYGMMVIGTLALMGVPFFSGYYSKEAILASLHSNGFLFYSALASSILTILYSWRLIFIVFHGPSRMNEQVEAYVHESPLLMRIPLFIICIGAVFSGLLLKPYFLDNPFFKREAFYPLHLPFTFAVFLKSVILIIGFFLYHHYVIKRKINNPSNILFYFLERKWFFDDFYRFFIIVPFKKIGKWCEKVIDYYLIETVLINGLRNTILNLSTRSKRVQSGYINHYIMIMILGLIFYIFFILK